jgi:hypothetical protein
MFSLEKCIYFQEGFTPGFRPGKVERWKGGKQHFQKTRIPVRFLHETF